MNTRSRKSFRDEQISFHLATNSNDSDEFNESCKSLGGKSSASRKADGMLDGGGTEAPRTRNSPFESVKTASEEDDDDDGDATAVAVADDGGGASTTIVATGGALLLELAAATADGAAAAVLDSRAC